MPSLPQLKHREVVKLLKDHGCEIENPKAPQLIGNNRLGASFTIHLHPSDEARPDILAKILKYANITREEFEMWYNKGRK